MNKNDLENKLSDVCISIEEISSKLKALSDEAKDALRELERIDLDDLEIEKEKEEEK